MSRPPGPHQYPSPPTSQGYGAPPGPGSRGPPPPSSGTTRVQTTNASYIWTKLSRCTTCNKYVRTPGTRYDATRSTRTARNATCAYASAEHATPGSNERTWTSANIYGATIVSTRNDLRSSHVNGRSVWWEYLNRWGRLSMVGCHHLPLACRL